MLFIIYVLSLLLLIVWGRGWENWVETLGIISIATSITLIFWIIDHYPW